jgi:2-phospho-L-lactate guanylyltransferase
VSGGLVILVPVKALAQAKSRLTDLGEGVRGALVLAMLEDVLTAATEARVGSVAVVSADAAYDALLERYGVPRVPDAGDGYNEAVEAALALEPARDADAVLVLPGDLPGLRSDDVRALAAALEDAGVVAAPSLDGGTSALGLRPPRSMRPRFGLHSFAAHREGARARGLRFTEVRRDGLLVDVDSRADLVAVADRAGPATAAVLRRLERCEPA